MNRIFRAIIRYAKIAINSIQHAFRRLFHTNIKVMPIKETIAEIKENQLSVSRFGDGELLMMMPSYHDLHSTFQEWNKEFSDRLHEVAQSKEENVLICLPPIFGSYKPFIKYARKFFWLFRERETIWYKYFNRKKIYGNSHITRCYNDYIDKSTSPRYFEMWKEIWADKDILLVEGEYSRLGVGTDLFDNAKSMQRILCPKNDAYKVYDEILDITADRGKEKLILIALGATATVLAYDLAKLGLWAIDIGHIDVEYCWMKMGATKKVPIPGKFVNEAGSEGRKLTACTDDAYNNSIIARIGLEVRSDE